MNRGEYTLDNLLREPQLGLELLTGGDDALSTPITGAHAIELENPSKWLDRGWMMLTMGVRLRNEPKVQRDLIAELRNLGASCLGFGVGLAFTEVPPALLDEAERQGFPVVLIPEETQFRNITRAVFQSTESMESRTFQRLSSIQQNLIRAFADPNPLESIVQRLGRLVHSAVAVISLDGHVDVATGAIPVAQISASLSEQSNTSLVQLDVEGWKILAAPVNVARGPSARWLVVAFRQSTVDDRLARAAVQVTLPLVDALMRLSVMNQGQDRAIRQSLLDLVLDESPESLDKRTLAARISALGLAFGDDLRTVVVRERPGFSQQGARPVVLGDLTTWFHSRLEGLGARYLLSCRAGEIVLVLNSAKMLRNVSADVVETWPTLTVGIGRSVYSPLTIRASYRDAQMAVQHLTLQSDGKILSFEDLDLVTQLLAEVPMERLANKAASMTALLNENPLQLEALRAFFAMNRDIKAAAQSIYLHPNTLRYRLERFEHALGRSLREPSVTASLYCVLTLMSGLTPAGNYRAPSAAAGATTDDLPGPVQ